MTASETDGRGDSVHASPRRESIESRATRERAIAAHEEPPRARWPGTVVSALLVAAFALLSGPIGAVAGVVTAAVWYAGGVPYAIAVGAVFLGTVHAAFDPPVLAVAALLGAYVPAEALARGERGRALWASVVAPLALGAPAWLAVSHLPLWLAAVVVLGTLTLAGYALHRLTLFDLGVLDSTDSTSS